MKYVITKIDDNGFRTKDHTGAMRNRHSISWVFDDLDAAIKFACSEYAKTFFYFCGDKDKNKQGPLSDTKLTEIFKEGDGVVEIITPFNPTSRTIWIELNNCV